MARKKLNYINFVPFVVASLITIVLFYLSGYLVFNKGDQKVILENKPITIGIVQKKSPTITPTPGEYDLPPYADIETLGYELYSSQIEIFKSSLNSKVSNSIGRELIGKNRDYWTSGEEAQNHEYFIKNGYVCMNTNAWCVGTDEQNVEECRSYEITGKEWVDGSMQDKCCRSIKTGKPYVFGCRYVRDLQKPGLIQDLEFTKNLLKENGVDCTDNKCGKALETLIFIY